MSFSSNDDNEVRAILNGARFGRPDFIFHGYAL